MVLCVEVQLSLESLLSLMICFPLVTRFWYFVQVCTRSAMAVRFLVLVFVARSHLAVRIFFTKVRALCFFGNELLQIEYIRGVLIETSTDECPSTIWAIIFQLAHLSHKKKMLLFESGLLRGVCTL